MQSVLVTIVVSWIIHESAADVFTSMAHLESLVRAEKDIPKIITNYVIMETKRLQDLRRFVDEASESDRAATISSTKTFTNPVNAFLIIKKLVKNWMTVKNFMKNDESAEFRRNVTAYRNFNAIKYPTQTDLSGMAIGLLRLQDTYRLNTKDIADGIKLDIYILAGDCFEIGRVAYLEEDYYHTILWMQEALNRVMNESESTAPIEEILEYLAYSLYKQGNLKHALQLTDRLYKMAPNHPRAKGNVKWYEDLLLEEGVKRNDMRRHIGAIKNERSKNILASLEQNVYEALCRDEVPVSIKETSKLYCYYKMDRPYLLLAPFKVEILRFNPLAVLFHDVISDEEVKIIQTLASPKLKRATVQNSETGELETATYRISKSAWLRSYDHEVVDRINKRCDLMTNLEQETAEQLQIANYGIGGHYDPHFDFARKEEPRAFDSLGTGNRIATVLFYMTQPTNGGGTVFTELKTANDALFWYNLLRSGEGDLRTRHAACPVLTGVKWVANKWIHERGQEFRRPCGLKPSTSEKYVGDLSGIEPRHHLNIKP
uniref:procollagen-proline 4-dioxygenase n=1 Tax=Syphacia muris TaxID=451379 RepID=A0A0N5AR18_9BILA